MKLILKITTDYDSIFNDETHFTFDDFTLTVIDRGFSLECYVTANLKDANFRVFYKNQKTFRDYFKIVKSLRKI